MQLRPYQSDLVNRIRFEFQQGRKSVLMVLSTGGGKTCIFSYIAQSAAKKGNRICILVHRQELLDQASRSLTVMGVPHGRIAAGRGMDLSHAVQVASVATLARRLHLLPPDFFQLLVVDEAHHTNAGTWASVVAHFNTARLLGVTATPVRGDGRGLGEWYQSMVQGPSAAWLTEHGFLAPAKVLAPPGFNGAGLRKRMGDFDSRQAEERVTSIHGDCYSHYCKHLSGQTAIAFCCSVAHAEAVAELFKRQGIAAASIDGSMDATTRRQLLEDLGAGRLKVLTSCALIGEGVDVPSVGGCILLRPTQSVGLHLQMIGRCLRPQDGKRAVILDHVGNTLRLGHHLEDRDWTLEGIKKQDREKAPSVKVCPVCFAAMASTAQACGDCGHEFRAQERELMVVPGELQEVRHYQLDEGDAVEVWHGSDEGWLGGFRIARTYDAYDRLGNTGPHADVECTETYLMTAGDILYSVPFKLIRPDIRQRKREQGNANSLEALRQLAQQRGYKRGWAERVYQARLAKRYRMD